MGMATHSSILAWRIPWTEEPGRLQSTAEKTWTQLSDQHFHFTPFVTPLAGSDFCPPRCHLLSDVILSFCRGKKASGSSSMGFEHLPPLQFPPPKALTSAGAGEGQGSGCGDQDRRLSRAVWGQHRLGAGAITLVLGLPFFFDVRKKYSRV